MPDMRFAPPPSLRVADRKAGMNQVIARSLNERLIMSMLFQHDGLTRMQMGQRSGLSAQTISVLVRALERDGLVLRGEAVKGRVGPPTIPVSLNPGGAYSVGISLGARNMDVVLINFVGDILHKSSLRFDRPRLPEVVRSMRDGVADAIAALKPGDSNRLAGIGLSMPSDIDHFAPDNVDEEISRFDFEGLLQEAFDVDIFIQNDITAAVSAESMFGVARDQHSYLFCHLGPCLTTRLILDDRIYSGELPEHQSGEAADLLEVLLDQREASEGIDSADLTGWISSSAEELQAAFKAARRFVDVDTLIVSGLGSVQVTRDIAVKVDSNRELARSGKPAPTTLNSTLGPWILATGAASLSFHHRFMADSKS
jgi:predicted NBD/HSP70 family sugar kinase